MNREVHEKKKQMKQQNEKKVKYGELSPWKKDLNDNYSNPFIPK